MAITQKSSDHRDKARLGSALASPGSEVALLLRDPADPDTMTPRRDLADPGTAIPLMGPADLGAAIPLMGPADRAPRSR